MANLISEKELNKLTVEIAKRVHPFYREEPTGKCLVYDKSKFLNCDVSYYRLEVNYDNFGKVFVNEDGTFTAHCHCRYGVYLDVKGLATVEEAIEQCINEYYR